MDESSNPTGEEAPNFTLTFLSKLLIQTAWTPTQIRTWLNLTIHHLKAFKREALEVEVNCTRLIDFLGPSQEWKPRLFNLKHRCRDHLVNNDSEDLHPVDIMAKSAVLITNTTFQSRMWDSKVERQQGKEFALLLFATVIHDIQENPVSGFFQELLEGPVIVPLPPSIAGVIYGPDISPIRHPLPSRLYLEPLPKIPLLKPNKTNQARVKAREVADVTQMELNKQREKCNGEFEGLQRERRKRNEAETVGNLQDEMQTERNGVREEGERPSDENEQIGDEQEQWWLAGW